jgi:prepilin-type N-terminal cleavage/methylation domain-containing protein
VKRSQAGFTLIEVLIAAAVLGLLVAGLDQTVRFAMMSWHAETHLSGRNLDLLRIDNRLRLVLRELSPNRALGRPPLIGTKDLLIGVSRLPMQGAGTEKIPVEIALGRSGNRFVLRWRPYVNARPIGPVPPMQDETLAVGIDQVLIAYDSGTGWTEAWTQSDLPRLIRIRIIFANAKAHLWPDFIIAPELTAP